MMTDISGFQKSCLAYEEAIKERDAKISVLQKQIKELEAEKKRYFTCTVPNVQSEVHDDEPKVPVSDFLDNASIHRYSRQLILPEIGPKGQKSLKASSVLIVGAGGLGCPAGIYIAAAGIGKIGIVDYDEVEISNLHRQILHTENRIGISKSASAALACQQLNSSVICVPYHLALNSSNAIDLIKNYDIVLDCTDNVATRYLLNDACVLTGRPLVSGSALRFEGQLTVYNYKNGPCYRCLYPKPPPPEMVTNCSDGGVLGVVPGIIGCLQALEVFKIAALAGNTYSQKLLLFDGLDGSFRTIKLRPRQSSCVVCGTNPTIMKLIDYEQFCGAKATDKTKELNVLTEGERINVKDFHSLSADPCEFLLIDVRLPVELEICQLPNSINIPMSDLKKGAATVMLKERIETTKSFKNDVPVYVVCRQGNDSQKAVRILQDILKGLPVTIKDIKGGLTAWAKHVDKQFPLY